MSYSVLSRLNLACVTFCFQAAFFVTYMNSLGSFFDLGALQISLFNNLLKVEFCVCFNIVWSMLEDIQFLFHKHALFLLSFL